MPHRGESVPFAFIAEADDFSSNIARPSAPRPSAGRLVGNLLLGLVLISGLVGAVLLATPALDVEHQNTSTSPEAVEGH